MKQLKLFLALLIIGAMAVSCKKEEEQTKNTDAQLVTKIITTYEKGQKTTREYEYNGTKIKKITEGNTVFTYTYTGDNITKIVESNERGVVKSQSFVYTDGKLVMWAENLESDSETCFFCETVATIDYNADGSQTVKYYEDHKNNVLGKQVEITKIPNPGNKTIDIYKSNPNEEFTISTRLDNPHKNITGWTKLEILDPLMYSEHSVIKYIYGYSFPINYDTYSGFPREMTLYYSVGEKEIYKKEYFYNNGSKL